MVLGAEGGPVGRSAGLAERLEDEALHAPDEQRLRRQGHAAEIVEILVATLQQASHVGRRDAALVRLEVPLAAGQQLLEQSRRVELRGLGQIPEGGDAAGRAAASPAVAARAIACSAAR